MGASVALVVLVVAAAGDFNAAMDEDAFGGMYYLFSWLVGWLYYSLMHSSSWQATLGKRALGIKLTSLSGERIGFGRATGRFFATFLSAIILGIGYLMAAFTARRQALHDMIAGTLVVSRNATPAAVSAGLTAPRLSGGDIAVAVLVTLVPVTGMLAAIAIPAYNDYALRSQVTEGLLLSSEYKAAAEALYNGADGIPATGGSGAASALPAPDSAVPVVPPGHVSVRLSFATDSWAEIYDGAGQTVLYDLGRAGTERTIAAAAPLSVTFGNAPGVTLVVNGRATALPPLPAGQGAARFTIAADGSLR
jgi:uncharacterized RDD family membrane protein YckC